MTLTRLLLLECEALVVPAPPGPGGASFVAGAVAGAVAGPGLAAGPSTAIEDDGAEVSRRLRRFARVLEALTSVCPWADPVRPGVCTLPIKGPTRYFGSEEAVLEGVAEVATAVLAATAEPPASPATVPEPPGTALRLGVADGVFAASLAARCGVVVPAGETVEFLAPWPVDVLGDPELADVLVRLGLSSLGRFAAVPAADVLARFGTAGARCHRVARGLDGELPGFRVPGMAARLAAALGRDLAPVEHQPGFWGGASAADERAAEVLTALQRRLGVEAVLVPELQGGRSPAERCRLVPWRPAGVAPESHASRRRAVEPPWPGSLPTPAPARVAPVTARACAAEVVDEEGTPVVVTGRGLLSGHPASLSVAGGPWTPVTGWSTPWPVEERWWSRARRRVARLQVLTADGVARLLVVERSRWQVEATYD